MMDHKITILFLSADPSDASRLRLGQEFRDIQEKLQLARLREQFSLEVRMSVRPGDVTQAIFDTDPQIVHFSGHGTSAGELSFEDESGKVQTVQPDALASLFELVASQVRCVILNACFSEIQAKIIAKHVDYVIGMKEEIGDQAAIAFAVGFYRALCSGRSLEDSYKFGIVELKLLGIPEHLTPVLLKKDVETQSTIEPGPYFPLQLDNEWIYSWSNTVYAPLPMIETLVISEKIGSKYRLHTHYKEGDNLGAEGFFGLLADSGYQWVFIRTHGKNPFPLPLIVVPDYLRMPPNLFPASFEEGDTWEGTAFYDMRQKQAYAGETTVVTRATTVLAGGYSYTNCLQIRTVITGPHPFGAGTRDVWFAPNIGLVKFVYDHDDGSVTAAELQKVTIQAR